jgi:hypothetical protein
LCAARRARGALLFIGLPQGLMIARQRPPTYLAGIPRLIEAFSGDLASISAGKRGRINPKWDRAGDTSGVSQRNVDDGLLGKQTVLRPAARR